jgi:hypothetical protein
MGSVTYISEYKGRQTVETLEALLTLARSGKLTGLIFACKYDETHHGVGITGDYRTDPIVALGVSGRLLRVLGRYADQLTDFAD